MEKRKLLIALVLFLVITNAVTIITVLLHTSQSSTKNQLDKKAVAIEVPGTIPDTQRVLFFTKELKLDSEQQSKFRNIQRDYMRGARAISAEMSRLRDDLLQAMDQDQTDSIRLSLLSEQIGIKHTELKKLTVKYYIGLKAICKPDQQEQLYEIIRKIIKPDGDVQLPEGEGGRKGGRGQGRGPWWQNKNDSVINK